MVVTASDQSGLHFFGFAFGLIERAKAMRGEKELFVQYPVLQASAFRGVFVGVEHQGHNMALSLSCVLRIVDGGGEK
ncbi:hypothetical protein CGH72_08520 [Vibrio parahaemolyticus]|nr:hypothetical protein CGI25_22360 [Vibrio parahaemolyticus]TOM58937.1 hypothetical protein CGH75_11400 [Vibrio parahaemolyticus]TOM64761.1 hypothetical protein CGH73_20950 [Vibrio parahaemolyticus]TOM73411.1 hypothetical protein CGH72_08520 [Vibrio parahaemolyticus]TOM99533.1 hypothetical protein CGH67_24270 [Vibrio parahaemolyticus]